MNEKSVRRIDLEHLESGLVRSPRRLTKRSYDPMYVTVGHFCRFRPTLGIGNGRRCNRGPGRFIALRRILGVDRRLAVPRPPLGCLSTGMSELDPRNGTLACEETGDRPQVLDLRVAPEPQVAMRPSAILFDGSRFDEDKARSAQGEAAEMNQVPIIRLSVPGPILAHGRNGDAILERDLAQLEGGEENGHPDGTLFGGLLLTSVHSSEPGSPQARRMNVPGIPLPFSRFPPRGRGLGWVGPRCPARLR